MKEQQMATIQTTHSMRSSICFITLKCKTAHEWDVYVWGELKTNLVEESFIVALHSQNEQRY